MKKAFIISLFSIYLFSISANAKSRKIESIPFEMVGSYVVINVKINDSSPLNLILDSGIRNTIITELEPSDKITLSFSDVKDMMGLGGGGILEAYTSNFNLLKIGKLKFQNKIVYVLKNDVFNLSKHSGSKINGLIGVDFFQDHIVEIDYSSKHIRFYEPTNFEAPKGYEMMPITIESQKMFVELSVVESDSTHKQVKMLMDTGAELNAWFQTTSKESVKVPPKWVQGTIGEGLNGIITGKYSHIPQICFGNFCLKNAIVSFPDSATITGIVTNSRRDGTVGSQLLSRFNLFIDYKQKKFYFKPNKNFKNPYSYNVAGIEIIQYSPVIPVIEVMDVWSNSPAAHAGVQRDDQIIEINGTSAFQMSVGEIRKIFETTSKRPLNLTLKRGKEEIMVQIDMKDKF
ncbi:MAG TPA: aspartyl protease family protein [Paludibacter sp.]|nr:aspartyl protease family protein [Paludibacter sp.]